MNEAVSFETTLSVGSSIALIRLSGELDARTAATLRDEVKRAAGHQFEHLVLDVSEVSYLSSAGMRTLAYARQQMPDHVRIVLIGANDMIQRTVRLVGFQYNVELRDGVPGMAGWEEVSPGAAADPPVV